MDYNAVGGAAQEAPIMREEIADGLFVQYANIAQLGSGYCLVNVGNETFSFNGSGINRAFLEEFGEGKESFQKLIDSFNKARRGNRLRWHEEQGALHTAFDWSLGKNLSTKGREPKPNVAVKPDECALEPNGVLLLDIDIPSSSSQESSAGKVQKVIYARSKENDSQNPVTVADMRELYYNIFTLAIDNGIKKVAVPLMGSDIFKVPVECGMQGLMQAYMLFGKKFEDVSVVTFDPRDREGGYERERFSIIKDLLRSCYLSQPDVAESAGIVPSRDNTIELLERLARLNARLYVGRFQRHTAGRSAAVAGGAGQVSLPTKPRTVFPTSAVVTSVAPAPRAPSTNPPPTPAPASRSRALASAAAPRADRAASRSDVGGPQRTSAALTSAAADEKVLQLGRSVSFAGDQSRSQVGRDVNERASVATVTAATGKSANRPSGYRVRPVVPAEKRDAGVFSPGLRFEDFTAEKWMEGLFLESPDLVVRDAEKATILDSVIDTVVKEVTRSTLPDDSVRLPTREEAVGTISAVDAGQSREDLVAENKKKARLLLEALAASTGRQTDIGWEDFAKWSRDRFFCSELTKKYRRANLPTPWLQDEDIASARSKGMQFFDQLVSNFRNTQEFELLSEISKSLQNHVADKFRVRGGVSPMDPRQQSAPVNLGKFFSEITADVGPRSESTAVATSNLSTVRTAYPTNTDMGAGSSRDNLGYASVRQSDVTAQPSVANRGQSGSRKQIDVTVGEGLPASSSFGSVPAVNAVPLASDEDLNTSEESIEKPKSLTWEDITMQDIESIMKEAAVRAVKDFGQSYYRMKGIEFDAQTAETLAEKKAAKLLEVIADYAQTSGKDSKSNVFSWIVKDDFCAKLLKKYQEAKLRIYKFQGTIYNERQDLQYDPESILLSNLVHAFSDVCRSHALVHGMDEDCPVIKLGERYGQLLAARTVDTAARALDRVISSIVPPPLGAQYTLPARTVDTAARALDRVISSIVPPPLGAQYTPPARTVDTAARALDRVISSIVPPPLGAQYTPPARTVDTAARALDRVISSIVPPPLGAQYTPPARTAASRGYESNPDIDRRRSQSTSESYSDSEEYDNFSLHSGVYEETQLSGEFDDDIDIPETLEHKSTVKIVPIKGLHKGLNENMTHQISVTDESNAKGDLITVNLSAIEPAINHAHTTDILDAYSSGIKSRLVSVIDAAVAEVAITPTYGFAERSVDGDDEMVVISNQVQHVEDIKKRAVILLMTLGRYAIRSLPKNNTEENDVAPGVKPLFRRLGDYNADLLSDGSKDQATGKLKGKADINSRHKTRINESEYGFTEWQYDPQFCADLKKQYVRYGLPVTDFKVAHNRRTSAGQMLLPPEAKILAKISAALQHCSYGQFDTVVGKTYGLSSMRPSSAARGQEWGARSYRLGALYNCVFSRENATIALDKDPSMDITQGAVTDAKSAETEPSPANRTGFFRSFVTGLQSVFGCFLPGRRSERISSVTSTAKEGTRWTYRSGTNNPPERRSRFGSVSGSDAMTQAQTKARQDAMVLGRRNAAVADALGGSSRSQAPGAETEFERLHEQYGREHYRVRTAAGREHKARTIARTKARLAKRQRQEGTQVHR